jgi:hypothetical protein
MASPSAITANNSAMSGLTAIRVHAAYGAGAITCIRSAPRRKMRPPPPPAVTASWRKEKGLCEQPTVQTHNPYSFGQRENTHGQTHNLRPDNLYSQSHVRVRVTLRLTVSQPVCLGVVPHLGHMTRNLFFVLNLRKLQSCLCGRPL